MRIICVTNQKGGCGKTTTAINLAASLSLNDRKVLLIDLDPQAHATLGLNIKADLSIYNVLSKITSKKAQLEEIIKNVNPNFDIAPSGMILSTLEQELAGEIGRESCLNDTINNFKGSYDYLIIDSPPNLGILTVNAIRASSEVIIPVEASRFSLEGVSQLLSIIELIKDRLNHKVRQRVLVANFDSRLRHSFEMLNKIKADFKDILFSNIVHVNVKLKEAQNSGTHIFNFDKYCRGAKDYFSLSREIITAETEVPEKFPTELKDIVKRFTEKKMAKVEKRLNEILKEELPKLNEVVFSVSAPAAKEVFLVGEFNNWKADESGKMNNVDGTWIKSLMLHPGKYRYRFIIDGSWTEDEKNPLKESNPFGTLDSFVEVEKA
ncbi:MAG: AAA family ATPase [Candidatus Omnitrophota bacterium]|jgi:chromosome partitioning protein